MEIWKTYKQSGGEGSYHNHTLSIWEVSSEGRIRHNGELYEPKTKKNNYLYFAGILVHRAVAELFIPNPDNKPYVDHIDTNKQNNAVSNLRWVTPSENMANPITKQRAKEAHNSVEYCKKISDNTKKQWLNPEYAQLMSKTMSRTNKGRKPWNYGLTKDTDMRLKESGIKISITKTSNKQGCQNMI